MAFSRVAFTVALAVGFLRAGRTSLMFCGVSRWLVCLLFVFFKRVFRL